MVKGKKFTGLNRREFLKVGVLGTTSALIGGNSLAKAVEYCSAEEPFAFPGPVLSDLGPNRAENHCRKLWGNADARAGSDKSRL